MLGGGPYQTNINKKENTNNCNLLQEKTTTTMDRNQKENHRTVRKNDEEIRPIRLSGENKRTNKLPPYHSGGECDMLPP